MEQRIPDPSGIPETGTRPWQVIDRSLLKWIAVCTMIIDHVGAVLFPQTLWLRVIGRIAFPIYAFCLAEGFVYTRDYRRYLGRLALLAVVSEVPFDLAFFGVPLEFTHQNIFFTLTLGLILLRAMDEHFGQPAYSVGIFLALGLVSEFLHLDYGMIGLLIIFSFYLIRVKRQTYTGWGLYVLANALGGIVQCGALLSILPLQMYNGRASGKKQRFFYWIYPLHLLLLWMIVKWIGIG